MKTKEITIAGKQVTITYNFGTEIGFKANTNMNFEQFLAQSAESIQKKQRPDTACTIAAIIAGALSYYEGLQPKQKSPITSDDLMFSTTPDELDNALLDLINLRKEFYHIPDDEPKDETHGEDAGKN